MATKGTGLACRGSQVLILELVSQIGGGVIVCIIASRSLTLLVGGLRSGEIGLLGLVILVLLLVQGALILAHGREISATPGRSSSIGAGALLGVWLGSA